MSNAIVWSIGIVLLISVIKSLIIPRVPGIARFARGKSDSESIGSVFAAISIFASLAGGFMVFGLLQVGYEGGVAGYLFGLAYLIGIFGLYKVMPAVAKRVPNIRSGYFVIDKLILDHYGPKSLVSFYIMAGILFAGVLGGQFLAISFYLDILPGISNTVVVLGIGLLGTAAYTVYGGFTSVLSNDWIQGIAIFATAFIFILGISIVVSADGGVSAIDFRPLDNGVGGTYGILYAILGPIFLATSFVVRPDLWQRVSLVKQEDQRRALLIAAVALFVFYVVMTTAGIIIYSNASDLGVGADTNPGALIVELLDVAVPNQILQIVVLSGILLALLSSIDSYLLLVSLVLTKAALWGRIGKIDGLTEEESRATLANTRVAMLGVFVVAGVMAVAIPDIVDLLSASFSILGMLIPIAGYAVFAKSGSTPDWVATASLWTALLILGASFPLLRESAFVPAVAIGTLVFGVFVFIARRKGVRPTNTAA